MPSTENLTLSPTPSILIVGDSGTHKTHFIGSATKVFGEAPPSVFVFDLDFRLAVLRGRKGIDYDSFRDMRPGSTVTNKEKGWYSFGTGWSAFIKKLNDIGALMDKGDCSYKVLGFDGLTQMSDLCMNYVMQQAGKAGQAPQIQDYGSQQQLLKGVLNQLTAWDIVKIMTAHIQRNQNDLTQVIEMLPLVTGKLAGAIGIYFDEVYFGSVKTKGVDPKLHLYGLYTLTTMSDGLLRQAKSSCGVPNDTPTDFAECWKFINKAAK